MYLLLLGRKQEQIYRNTFKQKTNSIFESVIYNTFTLSFATKSHPKRMAFLLAPLLIALRASPLFGQQPPLLTGRRVPAAKAETGDAVTRQTLGESERLYGATSGFPEASFPSFGGSRRRSLSVNEIGRWFESNRGSQKK